MPNPSPGILSFLDNGGFIVDLGDGRGGSVTRDAAGNVVIATRARPSATVVGAKADGTSGSNPWTAPAWLKGRLGTYAPLLILLGIVFFAVGGLSRLR